MKFLVFQHIDCEHPGIFRDLMRDDGVTYDAVELDANEPIPDFDAYDALLVMGGPMDVWEADALPWMQAEIRAISDWVRSGRPYLGFCLGHQLLATALGGEVGPAARPEIGVMPVTLTSAGTSHWFFSGAPAAFHTLQWHSAEVTDLPEDATVLADSEACMVNAMAWGDNAVSVQFHVELTPTTVAEWGDIPAYANALENALGEGAMAGMQSESDRRMGEFNALSSLLYRNFAARVRAANAVTQND